MEMSRMAQIEDIYAVTELRLQYLREAYNGLTVEQYADLEEKNIEYLKNHLNKDCFVAIAIAGGQMVSCAYMNVYTKAANLRTLNGVFAEIYGVYTLPQFRKQYMATSNMMLLLELAKKEKISFVELEASQKGYNVYARIGFKQINFNYKKMIYYC